MPAKNTRGERQTRGEGATAKAWRSELLATDAGLEHQPALEKGKDLTESIRSVSDLDKGRTSDESEDAKVTFALEMLWPSGLITIFSAAGRR
jgi:hypothetical protein